MIQDKTGFRKEKKKVKNINIRKTHRLSKLTVKWIPMLLQRWEFLHKESIPFSVEFQYLEH
jgi:hypothetical protein